MQSKNEFSSIQAFLAYCEFIAKRLLGYRRSECRQDFRLFSGPMNAAETLGEFRYKKLRHGAPCHTATRMTRSVVPRYFRVLVLAAFVVASTCQSIAAQVPDRPLQAAGITPAESAAEATRELAEGQIFRQSIAPVLVTRCLACHGGKSKEGSYSLATVQEMFQAGDSELVPLVPGDDTSSELLRRITTSDIDERMPAEAEPLTPSEIKTLQTWIKAGALMPATDRSLPLVQLRELTFTPAPESYIKPLAVNALALTAEATTIFVSGYAEVLQWDLSTAQLTQRIPVAGPHVAAIAYSDASRCLVVSSGLPGEFAAVQVFDLSKKDASTPVTLLATSELAPALAFSPDGSQLAIAGNDGTLSVVRFISNSTSSLQQWTPHADSILAVAWSTDGTRLISAARDRTAKFFDTAQFQLIANYDKHERAVGGVAFADAGPMSYDETGKLRLWAGDNSDSVQTEIGNLPRQLQPIAVMGNEQFIADHNRIRHLGLKQKQVDDGKDKDDQPKTKKVWRFSEQDALFAPTTDSLTAIAIQDGTLVAGDSIGKLWIWQRAEGSSFVLVGTAWVARP